eukprot:6474085-Amphidinium_carterae.3
MLNDHYLIYLRQPTSLEDTFALKALPSNSVYNHLVSQHSKVQPCGKQAVHWTINTYTKVQWNSNT